MATSPLARVNMAAWTAFPASSTGAAQRVPIVFDRREVFNGALWAVKGEINQMARKATTTMITPTTARTRRRPLCCLNQAVKRASNEGAGFLRASQL